jgi:peptide/nickel transport system permease protein
MISYLLRRVGQAVIVVFLVTVVVFILTHLLPGGPARAILGPKATTQEVNLFNQANGWDRPLAVQYWDYVDKLLHGNLGYSYKYNQTVDALIGQYLPKSMLLVGLSLVLSALISVPLGMFQAVRRNKIDEHVLTGLSFIFYSMPVFWAGFILIDVFAVRLAWLPPEGPQSASWLSVLSDPKALILPVTTLTLVTVAAFSRYIRSSVLENLIQDYVRTARAKGAGRQRLLWRHVLRNSLGPTVTLVGLSLPWTLSGALVVEEVFNYPGLGLLYWNAAVTRDYSILVSLALVTGVATVFGSLLADVLYAVLDPRVRYT